MKQNYQYQYSYAYPREDREKRHAQTFSENQHPNSHYNSIPDSIDCLNHPEDPTHDTDEIILLRQALIDKHNKLLKELEARNALQEKLEYLEETAAKLERQNAHLLEKVDDLEYNRDRQFRSIELRGEERCRQLEERNRDLQQKLQQFSNKNGQLKRDLETMRNKMLEQIVVHNSLEDRNSQLVAEQRKLAVELKDKNDMLREKESHIDYLTKQMEILRRKIEKEGDQRRDLEEELHMVNRTLLDKNAAEAELEGLLRSEKEKNGKILQQIMSIQAEHKGTLHKMTQLEDQCSQYKDKVYWLEGNREKGKQASEQLERLTHDLNAMTALYKQKEKELEAYKKRPAQDAEKRRKNYEHTKDFVHKLESEQAQYEHTLRDHALRQAHRRPDPEIHQTSPLNRSNVLQRSSISAGKTRDLGSHRGQSRSPNPITHEVYQHDADKGRYLSMMNQVQELESALLTCNTEKKRILAEMDRIDATKVKTRDMIIKRRKLEDDLTIQDEKMSKVKDKLRKIKVL